jgi:ribosomal protein L24
VNLVTHYEKTTEKTKGGLVKREAPLHIAKLMLATKYDARRAKRGAAA